MDRPDPDELSKLARQRQRYFLPYYIDVVSRHPEGISAANVKSEVSRRLLGCFGIDINDSGQSGLNPSTGRSQADQWANNLVSNAVLDGYMIVVREGRGLPATLYPVVEDEPSVSVAEHEPLVEAVAGRPRPGRGQGFQSGQAIRVALEVRAMNAAIEYFSKDWNVKDVHANQSYDLLCERNGVQRFVEVKGTVGDGLRVIVTPGEVRHAREHDDTILFVLSQIKIKRDEDGIAIASEGRIRVIDPWMPMDENLQPMSYWYSIAE